MSRYMSTCEAAEYLRISTRTLPRYAREGRLSPAFKARDFGYPCGGGGAGGAQHLSHLDRHLSPVAGGLSGTRPMKWPHPSGLHMDAAGSNPAMGAKRHEVWCVNLFKRKE